MSLTFSLDRPGSEVSASLIGELDADLASRYPRQWIHGLHSEDADDPNLVFVVVWDGDRPVGCGAIRRIDERTTEVKRMYIKPEARRKGYSRKLLAFLEQTAQTAGYTSIRLETGTRQPEAIGLYESAGYRVIPAYGEYVGNPFSVCFEKKL